MLIKIICIVALLEFSFVDGLTVPMKKHSKYGDDVCSYTHDSNKYVKHCGKGKFCDNMHIDSLDNDTVGDFFEESNIEICLDLPNITNLYTESENNCANDFECEEQYKCIGGVCSLKCDDDYFHSSVGCLDNSFKSNNCLEIIKKKDEIDKTKYSTPEPNKICGKISSFTEDPYYENKGIYYANKYEYAYYGEVEDGEYVNDADLCQSGFALYFFKDGKLEDPKNKNANTNEKNTMFLRCITPISVSMSSEGECFINYKIIENGETFRYNVYKLNSMTNPPNSKFSDMKNIYCKNITDIDNNAKYIKLKSDKHREFFKMIGEERKTCEDLDNANKYTCQNNELIRTWYFFKAPHKYAAYNDRKKIRKVIDYLIQKTYPCYSLSKFLSIKFIYLLFLLLF